MKRETFKSIILVLLIISSIILFAMNIGINLFDEIKKEPDLDKIFDTQVLFSDGILPDEIILSFGANEYTITHDSSHEELWVLTVNILKSVFSESGDPVVKIEDIDNKEILNLRKSRAITLSFDAKINMSTILNSIGIDQIIEGADELEKVETIFISLEKPIIAIRHGEGSTKITLETLDVESLEALVSSIYIEGYVPYSLADDLLDNNRYNLIPDISGIYIPIPSYENILENIDYKYIENIVKEFMERELDSVIEIEDQEGTIYTDGDKILKIENDGLVTFKDSRDIRSKDRNLFRSIEYALEFISKNLGYDNTLYLKSIKEVESNGSPGYRLIFDKMTRDFKVELDYRGLEGYIVIDVYNDQVKYFQQFFRREQEKGNDSFLYIQANYNILDVILSNRDEILKNTNPEYTLSQLLENLEYVRLVYQDNGIPGELYPMWKIIVSGEEFIFDIEQERSWTGKKLKHS